MTWTYDAREMESMRDADLRVADRMNPPYSGEPTINGIPLSYYLRATAPPKDVMCSVCKEWTDPKNPCCGGNTNEE